MSDPASPLSLLPHAVMDVAVPGRAPRAHYGRREWQGSVRVESPLSGSHRSATPGCSWNAPSTAGSTGAGIGPGAGGPEARAFNRITAANDTDPPISEALRLMSSSSFPFPCSIYGRGGSAGSQVSIRSPDTDQLGVSQRPEGLGLQTHPTSEGATVPYRASSEERRGGPFTSSLVYIEHTDEVLLDHTDHRRQP